MGFGWRRVEVEEVRDIRGIRLGIVLCVDFMEDRWMSLLGSSMLHSLDIW